MEEKKKTEEKREEMAETGKKLQCEFRSRSRITIIGILVIAALVGTGIYCFPPCRWIKLGELDALLVDVSGLGFKKEDLKVQADTSGKLTVSGECAVEGNRWRRFLKTFQLPKDCNVREIEANLDKETLYVVLPKPADKMVKERGGGGVLRDPRKRKTLILSTVLVTVLVAGLGSYIASNWEPPPALSAASAAVIPAAARPRVRDLRGRDFIGGVSYRIFYSLLFIFY
ncbi:uncharacterized protein LOC122031627 [Zingiber officinale]|uniref:uncharacterized protein LOC122031627 n=1 Tax=Zingiber officinale TaxID=94328 RepID=UPI001C4ABFA3|nr:uncharacterized protein LOC122031627 [Zingiber officinale]